MSDKRAYYRQLLGRAVVLSGVAYVLSLGGTYNGILNASLQQASLALLTGGVIAWQVVYWRDPPRAHPLTALGPVMALWAAAYLISTLNNPSGRVYIGLWYAGLYVGMWFVLSDLRMRGLPGRWLTDAALLTTIPLIILALVQVIAWFPAWLALDVDVAFVPPRPPSALGNPNALGAVLAMLIPLGLVRARWALRRQDRFLWGVWVAFALGVLYLTYSRGAWLGTVAGLLVLAGLTLHRLDRLNPAAWRAWWRQRSHCIRIALVIAGCVALGTTVVLLVASLSAFDTPRRGIGSRLDFYEIAGRSFLDHPLTGTGPFTFGLTLLEGRSIPPDQPHAHAHNLPLNMAAEMGLPGLVALAATVVLIARHDWRSLRQASDPAAWAHMAACGAAAVAFGVQGLVDMPMIMPAVMLLLIIVLAAGVEPSKPHATESPKSRARIVCRALLVIVWGAVLASGWWSARVYADYVRGERLLADGEYRRGADVLREVADAQPSIALYHAEYAYALGLAAYDGDESALWPAIDAYERALDREAPHAVWWANLAALYWQAGRADRAIEAMCQATRYAPDDPDMWLNLGDYYEESGQDTQARAAYHQTLDLKPLWGHSRFWTATPLRRAVLASNPVEPTPYMQAEALWRAGQTDAALAVLEARIEHDPSQPGPYIQIARLYLATGELDRVQDYIDAARVLVHTDPDRGWIAYVEAELARARGDQAGWAEHLEEAREYVLPDATGQALYYGRDVAYFQFLRVTVKGALLPQVHMLGPDPVLGDLLE